MVRGMAEKGERFDLALLDPPRVGAKDLMEDLVRLDPRRIAYVSCDPATLARDLKTLLTQGYRLEQATVFDQVPPNVPSRGDWPCWRGATRITPWSRIDSASSRRCCARTGYGSRRAKSPTRARHWDCSDSAIAR